MDKNKNVFNNPANGVATVAYKYDEQGKRTETVQYDKENVVVVPKN
jgi:hypothetical protein